MKISRSQLACFTASFLYLFNCGVMANPPSTASGLALEPLFIGANARPNIMFNIDDSGSMDWETMFKGTANGLLYWDEANKTFINDNGGYSTTNRRYAYLFPNGVSDPYNGQRFYSDGEAYRAIPPVRAYAFSRSSAYNQGYYDPSVKYLPWPSYAGISFPEYLTLSSVEATKFEPYVTGAVAPNNTLNLTIDRVASANAGEVFMVFNGMVIDDIGTKVTATVNQAITYFPATYYTRDDTNSSYIYNNGTGDETRYCNQGTASTYREFVNNHGFYPANLAIGPDGACLKKVEIKPLASPSTKFASGRTYVEEITNFATWFTYSRRRHQAMRGGLAASLKDISGIRAGMFWFNELNNVNMKNFDGNQPAGGDVEAFLRAHYQHVKKGGTPTLQSLDHAGKQFQRTTNSPPITASCQRNYTLLFTDGFANTLTTALVDNEDLNDGAPFADAFPDTLADIARKYYKGPLIPNTILDLGKSPIDRDCGSSAQTLKNDCNRNLHMNTYVVGLNTSGNIFGDATHNSVADAFLTGNAPVWADPRDMADEPVQADDLYHAAINGHGEIFNATNPENLSAALKDAVNNILESASQGGASSVAFNTSTLKNDSVVMSASFVPLNWSGKLEAYELSSTGAVGDSAWEASKKLEELTAASRYIITSDGSTGKLFKWGSSNTDYTYLTAAQKADLNTPDNNGEARLNYLRGDRTNEISGLFRKRSSKLGDIIHSSPVSVGQPEMNYPDKAPFGADGARYTSFKNAEAIKARKSVVYVGANDGMLHGFLTEDSGTKTAGTEVLAYIPNLVYSTANNAGLHYLTQKDYKHRNYVDGTPAVADVYTNSAWRTVLVSSLRGGGKGIFALDVTNPKDFDDANVGNRVLWEKTHADMGYITGEPVIAMMNNNRWAAVFGNGYGATGGVSKLLIVYIDDGSIQVVNTGKASGGLSAPALADLDGNGTVDRVYSGDLQGNMWAFDLSNTTASKWKVAHTSSNGNTLYPLFTARNAAGQIQPITSSPVLAINPNVPTKTNGNDKNIPNILVLFGTGQYLVTGDVTNEDVQSFYGVWDKGTPQLTRSNLVSRSIVNADGYRTIATGATAVDWEGDFGTQKFGWNIDFNLSSDTKERIVLSPLVRGTTVFFSTIIPSSELCSAGGRGYLMFLDLLTGSTPSKAVIDNNNDGIVNESDAPVVGLSMDEMPVGSGILGDMLYTAGNKGGTPYYEPIETIDGPREGRLSWLEIFTN